MTPENKDPTEESTIAPWGPHVLPYLDPTSPYHNIWIVGYFREMEVGKMEEVE
jgi:hypothetical protein